MKLYIILRVFFLNFVKMYEHITKKKLLISIFFLMLYISFEIFNFFIIALCFDLIYLISILPLLYNLISEFINFILLLFLLIISLSQKNYGISSNSSQLSRSLHFTNHKKIYYSSDLTQFHHSQFSRTLPRI